MKPTATESKRALDLFWELTDKGLYKALGFRKNGNPRFDEWIDQMEWELGPDWDIERGSTKVVIGHKDLPNWVIKVDLRLEDLDKPGRYCEVEHLNYEAAVKQHLDQYFAPSYYIGIFYYNGLQTQYARVFLQEKVTVIDELISERLKGVDDGNERDCLRAILGDNPEVSRLATFMENHCINDIHEYNWGKTQDGRIVCFDYSGYNLKKTNIM